MLTSSHIWCLMLLVFEDFLLNSGFALDGLSRHSTRKAQQDVKLEIPYQRRNEVWQLQH